MNNRKDQTSITSEYLHQIKEKQKKKKVSVIICSALAAIVATTTIVEMIQPAAAVAVKENMLDCHFEVHEHTDECYEPVYDEEGNEIGRELICGQADYVVHEHTADCYKTIYHEDEQYEETVLVCTLPETEKHEHDESCYEERQVLVCEEDHEHDESCYETEKVLICDKLELHTHTDECYEIIYDEAGNEVDKKLICGKIELLEHQHDESCFTEVEVAVDEEEAETAAEEETVSADMPAQSFHGETAELTVDVTAPEGAFPKDTTMSVHLVEDEDVLNAAAGAAEGTATQVTKVQAVDITFKDAEGKEIQPLQPIQVIMTPVDRKPEENETASVYHVDDKKEATSVELTEEADTAAEAVAFDADAFSVYALVYTIELETKFITAEGETYKITVTYNSDAGIPEDAELSVREIQKTEEEYINNVKATNRELQAQNKPDITNPVQFDISIVSNGVEVEPKEGSVVNVEIKLVPEVFETKTEDSESSTDGTDSEIEEGEIWFNGIMYAGEGEDVSAQYMVSHISNDGTVAIIDDVNSIVDDDNNVVLTFDTESFSDYLMGNPQGVGVLPSTIHVGDEIYMWDRADYWVTNIGSVVNEIKHPNGQYGNDGSDWKTVRATNTGTFRIYNRYNDREYKDITVLPAITETTPPGTIETIDNASIGLTLNLFDYDLDGYLDDYFNNYNHGNHPIPNNFLNHGINNGHALKFWGSGIGDNYGSANQYQEHGVTSIVQQNLVGGVGGYPQLREGSNPDRSTESLEYLFSPSNGTDKEAYTNVNRLFKKEGDYYVYDSNTNYAYYDKSQGNGGNFAVYERTYKQKSGSEGGAVQDKAIGFFPFHKWNEDYDLYVNWNKNLNHHFGMSMSVQFSLPKDPKAVVDTDGNPIIFEFSGDDDLWVFIDGKLAMDIGGVHQPTNGTINFQTGEVIVNGARQTGFNFSNLYDGKKHTLQVFYIERGGCDSNCMIKFNLTQYGDIHFDKVDKDNPSDKLAGAVFGIYKDADCTVPLLEQLKTGGSRAYVAESNAQGRVQFSDIPLGTYYLKELHAPEGYPLDETIHVVNVFVDQGTGEVKVTVTIDGISVENGVSITNKKPTPIDLGLQKEWQDENGSSIDAPEGVNAIFAIKRIRTYETYTEQTIEGQGPEVSHLTVGWTHNGRTHVYKEFDLIAGSTATISWSYVDGYEGSKDCIENGTRVDKDYVEGNVISEALTMPAAGGSATFFIVDESDNGEAIQNINVAGQQYYGNSGGGVIHTFETHTEPDPDFNYAGENVISNQVTLPINEDTWYYLFENLPTFGTGEVDGVDHEVAFNYSYYLEEVSSTAPEGTTVVYKDLNGNIISSPTDAETHTSGTETIINKVPFGYLKIEKKVTYNSSDQNLTDAQKSKLAGEYKFKIYTKQQCGDGDAVQDPNAAADAADKDLIITITIGEDGQAVSSAPIKLLVGNYWIKEVESSNPAMFPVDNPIEVTVTKDKTTSSPVISTLTNNYDENNGPDKIAIDIEKKFQGLDNKTQVPANFQVLLQYTVGGQTKTVTLQNKMATGENDEKISWHESTDGFTWHWKITNIPSEATDFKLKEENYDNAKGYEWKSATLNGTDITGTVTNWHDLTVTAPAATLSDVTNNRRTSDSGQNTEFYLEEDDILLTKLTANQGTLVISLHPLNLVEKDAVEKGWPSQGGFKKPPHYFSIEEHPNGFAYGDKTITFGEKDGKKTVKFTQNASAQETVYSVYYSSEEARNNANLVNVYEEIPITIDIIKVDKNNKEIKLPGAVFTIRQLADQAPTENGTLTPFPETESSDSQPTDANGKTSFGNLTHGYYEIKETIAPEGYVFAGDVTFYFKIESGEVTWLEKGSGKPSEWQKKTTDPNGIVSFEAAKAASGDQPATNDTFTVKNEPGAELPYTGGPGTHLYMIFGSILLLSAGILLIQKHRTTTE